MEGIDGEINFVLDFLVIGKERYEIVCLESCPKYQPNYIDTLCSTPSIPSS